MDEVERFFCDVFEFAFVRWDGEVIAVTKQGEDMVAQEFVVCSHTHRAFQELEKRYLASPSRGQDE